MSTSTPNFTKTDLRELADRARQSVEDATPGSFEQGVAQGVEDVLRTIVGDARPTPELTEATKGGLI